MEFRDLQAQYHFLQKEIDNAIHETLEKGTFIGGKEVTQLEKTLADFVEKKYCITCGNGTDALQLALMAWDVKPGDAIFVPDFTFFSTAEVVAVVGATPVFVDVSYDTFNMDSASLERAIVRTIEQGNLIPKAIIAVDLFGQPADYAKIRNIAYKYNLFLLEDGAQGFGGTIEDKRVGYFGDISTTSFFPAKPLGCYGDGGAVFTDNAEWAELISSYKVHGKGKDKYDNIKIGMNSRLDTLQAVILRTKFNHFINYELEKCESLASYYTEQLREIVEVPYVCQNMKSSWAQYTIKLRNQKERNFLLDELQKKGIPGAVYYKKPLHKQDAFAYLQVKDEYLENTCRLCDTVLSLPMHPYMTDENALYIVNSIMDILVR